MRSSHAPVFRLLAVTNNAFNLPNVTGTNTLLGGTLSNHGNVLLCKIDAASSRETVGTAQQETLKL